MSKPCFGNLGFQLSDRGVECGDCEDRVKCHEETLRLNVPPDEDVERREQEIVYRREVGRL